MKRFLLLFVTSLFMTTGFSQTQEASPTTQMTIMVIPFAKKGESIRKKLETNSTSLVAVTKMKEGFDKRGINTIDLRAKLKQLNNTSLLEEDAETTLKDEVIRMSGADIYVEVDVKVTRSHTGNSVTVVMTAYDAFSGQSLANKVSTSPQFHTNKFEKLTEKAIDAAIDDFLNTMQQKFDNIVENGRSLVLTVGVTPDTEKDFDMEINSDGDMLSDAIEAWVEQNAYKNYYHMQGVTKTKLIFDDIRIPLRGAMGHNYRTSDFVKIFRKYLKSLGLKSGRSIQGNNIVITIK